MLKTLVCSAVAFAAITLAASASHAAPVIFFGENLTPAGAVSGNPLAARTAFLSNLSGVVSQGFESFTAGAAAPLSLSFTGSGATTLVANLSGTGNILSESTQGRFNTTAGGSKWWESLGVFNIDFVAGSEISAFGFYGTDIGDFSGRVTITLTDVNNVQTELIVANTLGAANASLLFWGFVDAGNSYKRISFGNTNATVDGFGFDDMVIGDRLQIVNQTPEPASLALVGLALLGLAASRRNKRV